MIDYIEEKRHDAFAELIWAKMTAGRMVLMSGALFAVQSLPIALVLGMHLWLWLALCWLIGALAIAVYIAVIAYHLRGRHKQRDAWLRLGTEDAPESAEWDYSVGLLGGMEITPSVWSREMLYD